MNIPAPTVGSTLKKLSDGTWVYGLCLDFADWPEPGINPLCTLVQMAGSRWVDSTALSHMLRDLADAIDKRATVK